MIKAILFDYDGTVVNSLKHIHPAWNKAFQAQGINLSHEEVVRDVFNSTDEEKKAKYKGVDLDKLYSDFRSKLAESYPQYEKTPGIENVLKELKKRGIKTAICSLGMPGRIKEVLTSLQLIDFFNIILGRGDVPNQKPHPDIAFKAMEQLGVNRNEAILIGDSSIDIQTGKSAGILTGLYTPESNLPYTDHDMLKNAEPDFIFSHFDEFFGKIERF